MAKKLMLGNDAVARGLYEAGVRFISSYPGTPSTEITECASRYDEIYSEWAPNEKVACEAAIGAAIGGGRAFCAMKHVGLNVAADPLFVTAYTGVNGGLIIAVADDQGLHSSQNEQDSRHYAIAAKLPMVEPADSAECIGFVKKAYDLSEKYDTPFMLRLSTRISHSQSLVEVGEREERPVRDYQKNPGKYVMMPGNAKRRHVDVEERLVRMREELAESELFNKVEMGGKKIGVIAAGIAYDYAREALGDEASYLKLGLLNPLPEKLIRDFAAQVDRLVVIEELDDVIETHVKKLGLPCDGKNLFSFLYEYTSVEIKEKLLGEKTPLAGELPAAPVRPPVMCPGCPHRGLFYVLAKNKLTVSGDIGCYTLGAQPPLGAMDTTLCMGASISALHGFNTVRGPESAKKSVAVIGDSTFIHSGITSLIDIVYNRGISTVIIVDNSITGMTGHQQNPTTGYTIKMEPAGKISLEDLCRSLGIDRVRVVDPGDLKATDAAVKEELAVSEPSVIIARRPCALLKYVKHGAPLTIDTEKCVNCGMCLKLGCPAISKMDGKMEIDPTLCNGCGLCESVCAVGAIRK